MRSLTRGHRRAFSGLRALACTVAMATAGATALAEDERPADSFRGACRADFEAICANVEEGGNRGEVFRCLEEHKDELSDGCRAALDARAAGSTRGSRSGTCREEIRKLCPDARGPQAMRQCIEEHRDELPEECQQKPPGRGGFGRHGLRR